MQKTPVRFLGQEDLRRRDRLPTSVFLGFPCGSDGKEFAHKCKRPGFDPWVGKIPLRRERLPIPVFWPGEFQRGHKESDTTERLSFSPVTDFIFLGYKITADSDYSHEIKRCLLLGRKVTTNLDSILKSRDYFSNKGPSSQSYGFSSSHVWMWELDYKESWVPKSWWFWMVVLEKTLESPLDSKEIQPVHPKGNWSWKYSLGERMLKLKLQFFCHLMWRTNSLE